MKRIKCQNVLADKLTTELVAAGVIPIAVEHLNSTTWVTVKEEQEATVLTVVAAHNPTPYPPEPSAEEYLIDLDFRLSKIELGL